MMGLGTVNGGCSFLGENSPGYRSRCFWHGINAQADDMRDRIRDLTCDLIMETREIKQGVANQVRLVIRSTRKFYGKMRGSLTQT